MFTRKKKIRALLADHNLQVANLHDYDDYRYAFDALKHILQTYGHSQDLERRYVAVNASYARLQAKKDYQHLLNLKEAELTNPKFV